MGSAGILRKYLIKAEKISDNQSNSFQIDEILSQPYLFAILFIYLDNKCYRLLNGDRSVIFYDENIITTC